MAADPNRPPITPALTLEALLKAYPELEQKLLELAPPLAKLNNPALRQTVARITTLDQAARSAGKEIGELITGLRVEAGVEEPWTDGQAAEQKPAWLLACAEVKTYDAREEIASGSHPLPQVVAAAQELAPGQALALVTPFLPSPLIEKVEAMGFKCWTKHKGPAHFISYFARED